LWVCKGGNLKLIHIPLRASLAQRTVALALRFSQVRVLLGTDRSNIRISSGAHSEGNYYLRDVNTLIMMPGSWFFHPSYELSIMFYLQSSAFEFHSPRRPPAPIRNCASEIHIPRAHWRLLGAPHRATPSLQTGLRPSSSVLEQSSNFQYAPISALARRSPDRWCTNGRVCGAR
jgi:hypothetical protein